MSKYYTYPSNLELCHYGVKGMKWGVRHDYEPVGRRRSGKNTETHSNAKKSSRSTNVTTSKSSSDKNRFHLSEKQKKVLKVGAAIVGTALAAYGGYKLGRFIASGKAREAGEAAVRKMRDKTTPKRLETPNNAVKRLEAPKHLGEDGGKKLTKRDLDLRSREFDLKTGFMKKNKDMTPEEDLAAINRFFLEKEGSTNNCTFCTTAYELRRRGYDVTANFTDQGRSVNHAARFFKDAKIEGDSEFVKKVDWNDVLARSEKDPQATTVALRMYYDDFGKSMVEKYGEGARGNLAGFYNQGGGHSMIWEIKDSRFILRDGQTNTTYDNPIEMLQYFVPGKIEYFRTDNLEIDVDRIKEAVTSFGKTERFMNAIESDSELASSYRQAVVDFMRENGLTLQEARQAFRDAGIKGI